MSEVAIKINPGRLLFGLSRIGYTPSSAICDIVDNAVMAKANNIRIIIRKEKDGYSTNKRGNVKEYLIIDDGNGMSEEDILNALQLGSSDELYVNSTLSKFGLGMKSATFSQGDELYVVSGKNNEFNKFVVSLPEVQQRGSYFANKESLSEDDIELITSFLPDGKGTIIKIGKVRKEGHPSIKQTEDELTKKIGVIYYYYIKDDKINIYLGDKLLPAIDILFTDQANEHGSLNENDWNGREVRWIQMSNSFCLDAESNVNAVLEVTQLPHPPTFTIDERGGDKKVRDIYLIEAGNYGYYVYRNKRLISWADGFNGIIGMEQDLYSFRGRILIDDTADDAFNIDVKKSNITLSGEAYNTISDLSNDYKRKSIKAWNRAKNLKKEKENEEPNLQSNIIIEDLETPESLPGQPIVDQAIIEEVEKEVIETSKKRLDEIKKRVTEDLGLGAGKVTNEQLTVTALKGEDNPYATKIFRVPSTEDNTLYEPYYDAEKQHCVRINKFHRFSKLIFEDNAENTDLQVIFELILYQFAVSEVETLKYLRKDFSNVNIKTMEKIIAEFRRFTSEYLADMCRRLEGKLPPIK